MDPELYSQLVANLDPKVRRTILHGREYLVAPVTLVVPGVMNGSDGPLLYRPENLGKNASRWDYQPLVVYHPPVKNGKPLSAKLPSVMAKQGVGFLLNVSYSDKLSGEAWFDVELTQRVDRRVYDRLVEGQPIEVSTGVGVRKIPAPEGSVYNGVPYSFDTEDYQPDHLAILPDEKGACSIRHGCGVLNKDLLSHTQLYDQLMVQLEERFGKRNTGGMGLDSTEEFYSYCYILEVFDKEVVFSHDGKLWRIKYKTDLRSGSVELSSEAPVEVRRVVTYKDVTNASPTNTPNGGSASVEKEQLISFIVTNCSCWQGQGDREILNGFTEQKLSQIRQSIVDGQNHRVVFEAVQTGLGGTQVTNNAQLSEIIRKGVAPQQPVRFDTIEAWKAAMPAQAQHIWMHVENTWNQEKATLVNTLLNGVPVEQQQQYGQYLQSKGPDELRIMLNLANKQPVPAPVVGQSVVIPGGPVFNTLQQQSAAIKRDNPLMPVQLTFASK